MALNLVSLIDAVRNTDSSGKLLSVVNLMSQNNAIIQDVTALPTNIDKTVYALDVVTAIPTGTWRKVNEFMNSSNSKRKTYKFGIGILSSLSSYDSYALENIVQDGAASRLQDASLHIEGMTQEYVSTIFYGNAQTTPGSFNGLSRYYDTLGDRVIDGGGTATSNTSIWCLGWGVTGIHTIYPKDTAAGITMTDLGTRNSLTNSDGEVMVTALTSLNMAAGLVPADYRMCARICNLDTTEDGLFSVSPPDLSELIDQAVNTLVQIPTNVTGISLEDNDDPLVKKINKWGIYMNRTARLALTQQGRTGPNQFVPVADLNGMVYQYFRNTQVPIRICDALTNSESTVS